MAWITKELIDLRSAHPMVDTTGPPRVQPLWQKRGKQDIITSYVFASDRIMEIVLKNRPDKT